VDEGIKVGARNTGEGSTNREALAFKTLRSGGAAYDGSRC
jgi:hypothetical protein